MNKYFGPKEANKLIQDEEAVFTSFRINNDKSLTANVEIFLYLIDGKTYSALRTIRLKENKNVSHTKIS